MVDWIVKQLAPLGVELPSYFLASMMLMVSITRMFNCERVVRIMG
jgi:hypothetical protein